MGRGEKRELVSRLTVLMLHLLKWRHPPNLRGSSWRASIANARDDLADHLADNPSLRAKLGEAMEGAWRRARRDAAVEIGLEEDAFGAVCPFAFEQAMDENFWPA